MSQDKTREDLLPGAALSEDKNTSQEAVAQTISPEFLGAFAPTILPEESSRTLPAQDAQSGTVENTQAEESRRYLLLGEFGRGGLGRVIRAKDQKLQRVVALKELLQERQGSELRFLREALLTAQLEHPGIVPVHDIGRHHDGALFYAMKLLSGKPLSEKIASTKTLNERLALLPHMVDVCEAVGYAHAKHVIHRDLKPQNVIVGGFGETVVIDWGLAKYLKDEEEPLVEGLQLESDASLTQVGAIMGTIAYMPPEQAAGDSVDERADVYALGAMLYELFSGCAPYTGSGLAVLNALQEGPPPKLETRERLIPKDLLAIVNKAMARDPKDRYPNAKGIADDLRRFQNQQLVGVYAYSLRERITRFVAKNKALVAVACVALLVAVLSFLLVRRERDQAMASEKNAMQQRDEANLARQQLRDKVDTLRLLEAKTMLPGFPNKTLLALQDLSEGFEKQGVAWLFATEANALGVFSYQVHTEQGIEPSLFSPEGNALLLEGPNHSILWLDLLTGKEIRSFVGHSDSLTRLDLSPDQKWLASSSKDKTIRLWELSTGRVQVLSGHTSNLYALNFSPDGKHLLSADTQKHLRYWTLSDGSFQEITLAEDPSTLFFDNKQQVVSWFTNNQKVLYSWDPKTLLRRERVLSEVPVKRLVPRLDSLLVIDANGVVKTLPYTDGPEQILFSLAKPLVALSLSGDGRYIATLDEQGELLLFDVVGNIRKPLEPVSGSEDQISLRQQLFFSSDQSHLLLHRSGDPSLYLWSLETGQLQKLKGHQDSIEGATFSPDGRWIASAGADRQVRLWSVADGAMQHVLQGFETSVGDVLFSPSGAQLLAISKDKQLFAWHMKSVFSGTHQCRLSATSATALGTQGVWVGNQRGVIKQCRHDGSEEEILSEVGSLVAMALSPKEDLLAFLSADGQLQLYSQSQKTQQKLGSPVPGLSLLRFSPDGNSLLAASSEDGTLLLWNLSTKSVVSLSKHQFPITSIAFAPHENILATGDSSGLIVLWNVSGEERELRSHTGDVQSLRFSADGKELLSTSNDRRVLCWQLSTGMPTELGKHDEWAIQAVFLPNHQVVSAGWDRSIRFWGTPNTPRYVEDELIDALLPLANGEQLISLVGGQSVRILDVASREEIQLPNQGDDLGELQLSSDERWLSAMHEEGAIVWSFGIPRDEASFRTWLQARESQHLETKQAP